MLAAVFLSNLPEAVAATVGLRTSGWPNVRITGLWIMVAFVSGLAALAGLDHSIGHWVVLSLLWSAGLIAVFAPLAVARYRRT